MLRSLRFAQVAAAFVCCAIWCVSSSWALQNGVGLTPAMGWSSWNHFGGNISESLILDVADAIVSSGLRDAGYVYLNIDDGWSLMNRSSDGQLQPDPKLFPRGMKYVADQLHARGLKFGIYTSRTSLTCLSHPGSDGYEAVDAKTFASWGVDYLKEDSCGGDSHGSVWDQYARMRDALNATGRPIYFSICETFPWPVVSQECYGAVAFTILPWIEQGLDVFDLANSWLVEFCNMEDGFGVVNSGPGLLSNLDSQPVLTYANMSRPGGWNDMDMMEIGNGGMTMTEYQSHMSLWAIMTSPLILGNDPRNMTAEVVALLTNKRVIAINQDPLGRGAGLFYGQDPSSLFQVYVKLLSDGSMALCLFNRDNSTRSAVVAFDRLGFPATANVELFDVWVGVSLGNFQLSYTTVLQPHASQLLTAVCVSGCGDNRG